MDNPEERFFHSYDGTKIAYHVIGSGAPMILANGLGGTYMAWRHLYTFFKDRYRIYSWDYRGLYHSSPPDDPTHLRMADHVKDALALIETEKIAKAIWAGWSMGVQLSLEIYRDHPELFEAMVLINGTYGKAFDTAFGWKGSSTLIPAGARAAIRFWHPVALAGRAVGKWDGLIRMMKRLGLVSATLDEEIFKELYREFVTLDVKTYMTIFKTLGEHNAKDMLPRIAVPCLVIAGERDPFTPRKVAEKMAKKIPGCELCLVPGGTHYAPVEYPELVNFRIEKFFRERTAPPVGGPAAARPSAR